MKQKKAIKQKKKQNKMKPRSKVLWEETQSCLR